MSSKTRFILIALPLLVVFGSLSISQTQPPATAPPATAPAPPASGANRAAAPAPPPAASPAKSDASPGIMQVQDLLSSLGKFDQSGRPSEQKIGFELPEVFVNQYLAYILRTRPRPG